MNDEPRYGQLQSPVITKHGRVRFALGLAEEVRRQVAGAVADALDSYFPKLHRCSWTCRDWAPAADRDQVSWALAAAIWSWKLLSLSAASRA